MASTKWCVLAGVMLGCSSAGPAADKDAAAPDVGTTAPDAQPVGPMTWTDGTMLDGAILIPEGVTVTIAAGANVTCSSTVTITVEGTLSAASAQTHAKLGGAKWGGIAVRKAGTLALDGVDISGAQKAIDDGSSTPAKYDNGTITAGTPFTIAKGSALSTSHATIVKPAVQTTILGSFTASYLDYDSNGSHAIVSADPTARVSIEDSKFHGGPTDLVNGFGAAFFHVAYTDITGAHCGFHFTDVETLEIDHVTVHGVTNGADLWGSSSTGKKTITSSNFESLTTTFDEQGMNGPIDVTNCYVTGTNNLAGQSAVTITSPAAQPIANAGPR